MSYTVKAGGERLDRIAKTIYGSEAGGTVEALLSANAGLAARGAIIPEGTVIKTPETVETISAAPDITAIWE